VLNTQAISTLICKRILITAIAHVFCCATFSQPVVTNGGLSAAILKAESLIRNYRETTQTPGISVAVAMHNSIVWQGNFGYADIAAGIPITSQSRFRIGSVSKSLTSLAIAQLMDAGKIELDAPIQTYVPSFPQQQYSFSIRQLAGHLAGIRHYRNTRTDYLHPEHYNSVLESLAIFKNDSLLFEPGTRYSYSTYGYVLISAAIEKIAAMPFTTYMQHYVFDPLKMTMTTPDYADSTISGRTTYYQWDPKAQAVAIAPFEDVSYKWAGGGFLSNPVDLVNMCITLTSSKFITAKSRAALFTSQRLKTGAQTGYGMGWSITRDRQQRKIIFHSGKSFGGNCLLVMYPDQQLIIAICSNYSDSHFALNLTAEIAELFVGR
jgi:serine beta-lactamase-like protein LACTB